MGDIMKAVMILLIAPIIIVFIVGGVTSLIDKIVETKEEKEKIKNEYKTYLSNGVWCSISSSMANSLAFPEDRTQRIVDMPRLTFERWLTFYNLNPENWVIQKIKTTDIPYYAKLNEDKKWIVLPIFWSSPEEMGKYRDWVKNVYQYGDARIYQQKQEENYKKLVELVENDIKEKQDKVQQDLLNMRKELLATKGKDTTPTEEEAEVTLSLSDGTSYKVNKRDYEWYMRRIQNGYTIYKDGKDINANSYSIIK